MGRYMIGKNETLATALVARDADSEFLMAPYIKICHGSYLRDRAGLRLSKPFRATAHQGT